MGWETFKKLRPGPRQTYVPIDKDTYRTLRTWSAVCEKSVKGIVAEALREVRPSENRAIRCAAVLGIDLPAEEDALKKAFHVAARATHPDHGGDAAEFRRVKEAYDFLTTSGARVLIKYRDGARTVEGDLLCDLGRGLDSHKNTRDCEHCRGRGYNTRPNPLRYARDLVIRTTCYKCGGTGEVEILNPVLPKWRFAGVSQRELKRYKASQAD